MKEKYRKEKYGDKWEKVLGDVSDQRVDIVELDDLEKLITKQQINPNLNYNEDKTPYEVQVSNLITKQQ